ncbi:uncharacterized protein LOC124275464 [Haliotis rubra]|uniref:uncharacterized protein LOC124275464 n=1 Tax=Haliotis rubra TaxID=36100 RepID=UPI001EE5AC0E|nr:uncharacterized protein LOC124275464 [Haliotis rubra]
MRSSAHCWTFIISLTACSFIDARSDSSSCPGKQSVWDKWYDGCNWCVCTDSGPVCTDKVCSSASLERCETFGEKWRDGCYRCQCSETGIACTADHRCVHAMRYNPVSCQHKRGCVCGIDGVSSCVSENIQMDFQRMRKHHGRKYVPNRPIFSKGLYVTLPRKMSCSENPRWYSGSKRCFCLHQGEKTCGQPRHIAHRVDGFRFKIADCDTARVWNYNCKTCKCHMRGFGFCVRVPNCRRDSTSLIDSHLSARMACVPGRKWNEDCKYCYCTRDGRRICKDYDCNLSRAMAETNVKVKSRPTTGEVKVRLTGGGILEHDKEEIILPIDETDISVIPKFQIPPSRSFDMSRSFRTKKPPEIKEILCEGKYKPGEKFYDKCNSCECTETGDSRCTAVLCW